MNSYVGERSPEKDWRYNTDDYVKYLQVMNDGGMGGGDLKPEGLVSNDLLDEIGEIDVEKTISVKYEPKS